MAHFKAGMFKYPAAMLLAVAGVAGAHEPYESDGVARVEAEGLEVLMTASAEIAGMLIGVPVRSDGQLERARAEAVRAAGALYEIEADGRVLTAVRAGARLQNGEVIFSLMYPPVRAEDLKVRAVYLEKLPVGYGAGFSVLDESGKLLGRAPVLKKGAGKDAFSVRLKGGAFAPVAAAAAAATPHTLSHEHGHAERDGASWGIAGVSATFIAAAFFLRRIFRKSPIPTTPQ